MNLKELHEKVVEIQDNDPTITLEEASRLMADALAGLDPNKVRWAIEDEAEREAWQDVVINTALAHYYRDAGKLN